MGQLAVTVVVGGNRYLSVRIRVIVTVRVAFGFPSGLFIVLVSLRYHCAP